MSSHIFIFSYAPNSVFLLFAPSFLLLECLVRVLPIWLCGFLPPLDCFFWYSHLSHPLHSQAAVLPKISHILLLPSLNLSLPLIAVLLEMPWSLSLLGWGWLPLSAWLCQKISPNHIALVVWMMSLKLWNYAGCWSVWCLELIWRLLDNFLWNWQCFCLLLCITQNLSCLHLGSCNDGSWIYVLAAAGCWLVEIAPVLYPQIRLGLE